MVEYHAAYFPIEGGWFMGKVLDFPGVASQGRTLRSARRMVRDALRLAVEGCAEEGRPLPQPNVRAKAGKAVFHEKIPVRIKAQTGVVS